MSRSASSFVRIVSLDSVSSIDSKPANSFRISSEVSPRALRNTVTDCLRLRSMRTPTWSRLSISNSSHAPRLGMMRAETMSLSLVLSATRSKYTPGERTSCDTTTRSVPLMMNVPLSVCSGKSPMKTV